jgi:hypothetical protein
MKLHELFSMTSTTPQSKWNAMSVLHDILGGMVTDDDDDENVMPGMYYVSKPWVPGMKAGMFSNMDMPAGQGGAIGLPNPYGRTATDIASAAHEGYHAWLHMHGKSYNDERVVNQMAEAWLRANLSGAFLHQAIEVLLKSKIHYKHN